MTEETEKTEKKMYGNEVGNVIWFDQKKGFGFVKIITPNSEHLNKEIFIHYTSIQCENNFKKIYPGENISLNIVQEEGNEGCRDGSEDGGQRLKITDVTGLYGSQLLIDNPNYIVKFIKKRQLQDMEE
tara:strand:+ start:2785 stop:3168 length:384 start_codon:yes stop_codon:yes gene_type:complete